MQQEGAWSRESSIAAKKDARQVTFLSEEASTPFYKVTIHSIFTWRLSLERSQFLENIKILLIVSQVPGWRGPQ